jgi:hypothetical protein
MRRGSIFYLGYTTPSSVSLYISTDDGYPTTYHWRSSSASSWSNAVTTRKFALKVHSQYVDSLNLTAAGNESRRCLPQTRPSRTRSGPIPING